MPLQDEIDKAQRQVKTDAYPMSIGEIVNMYEARELVIRPPFQRLFRWETGQKSKFVESILLGIPIPPIFVFETDSGQWELIDGLQRLSTVLEFMGLLREDEDRRAIKPPSFLEGTRYIPLLKNTVWEKSARIADLPIRDQRPLDKAQQFFFRRAKLNVQILKRPSDAHTKYDLFQRLNRGGTQANAQEIRNCVVIMANDQFFEVLDSLSSNADFIAVAKVSEQGEQTQRPLQMVMRFFVMLKFDYEGDLDVEEFIDDRIIQLAEQPPPQNQLQEIFNSTFRLLREALGDDALRKYDRQRDRFAGRVGQVALEVIAVGVARNLRRILKLTNPEQFIVRKVKEFWGTEEASRFTASGVRGTDRLAETIPFGKKWFRP